MKNLVMGLILFGSLTVRANIDEAGMKSMEPRDADVQNSRSCFKELETYGCGHPRDDLEQFKACMANIFTSLSPGCQSMMAELYRRKN